MNIERLFREEIRDKKRIGSNIFSRVSTRKGGSSKALRVPYLYMSRKERNQLNGEVKVYNMNDIMGYQEFKERDEEEQKRLMIHWRENFKTQDIQDRMGVSRTVFYKIIDRLDIPKEPTNFKRIDKVILEDDELEKYTKEFIPFNKYRELTLEQQSAILESYIAEYGGVRAVRREWEGSDEGYMYSVRSRYNKKTQKAEEKEKKKNKQVAIGMNKDSNAENKSSASAVAVEDVQETQEDKINNAINLLTQLGYFVSNSNDEEEGVLISEGGSSNIDINTDSFSFNLNGTYDVKTIKRRIELVLEVIEDDSEMLNLNISISN